jgi:hypothetical protein
MKLGWLKLGENAQKSAPGREGLQESIDRMERDVEANVVRTRQRLIELSSAAVPVIADLPEYLARQRVEQLIAENEKRIAEFMGKVSGPALDGLVRRREENALAVATGADPVEVEGQEEEQIRKDLNACLSRRRLLTESLRQAQLLLDKAVDNASLIANANALKRHEDLLKRKGRLLLELMMADREDNDMVVGLADAGYRIVFPTLSLRPVLGDLDEGGRGLAALIELTQMGILGANDLPAKMPKRCVDTLVSHAKGRP